MTKLNIEMTPLQKALKAIHLYRGTSPLDAYKVIIKHQVEATPILLQILKTAIERAEQTGNYYVAHIHSLILLAEFKEKKAYPLIIELLNLPIKTIDRFIGDMLFDTIPQIVSNVYDGHLDPLLDLLTNQKANEFLRMNAGECLTSLFCQGLIDKQIFTLRLQEIVASGKMEEDRHFFTNLASITMDCKLDPLYDTIRAAFNADWICREHMDLKCFNDGILKPYKGKTFSDAASEIVALYGDASEKPIAINIGRNTLCPCGSGLKFKACCIAML